MSPLLCAKDVAEILACAPKTAAKLMRTGALSAFKLGNQWRTNTVSVHAYVSEQLVRCAPCAMDFETPSTVQ